MTKRKFVDIWMGGRTLELWAVDDFGQHSITSIDEYYNWAAKQRELVVELFKPKPDACPFCKSDDIEPVFVDGWKGWMICRDCGANGPDGRTEAEAIQLWNERK